MGDNSHAELSGVYPFKGVPLRVVVGKGGTVGTPTEQERRTIQTPNRSNA